MKAAMPIVIVLAIIFGRTLPRARSASAGKIHRKAGAWL